MKKYVIISDSCCDLGRKFRDKYDILYVPNQITYNGNTYPVNLDWENVSAHDYFEMMKNGTRVITSQVNRETYLEAFEKAIKDGYDVLSLSCSSALSNSVKTSYMARDELLAKYPESKIICIDTLISTYGLGMLCIQASIMRSEGKTIEETASWIEEHKLEVQMYGTVNDLKCLKMSGRVTATAALFGTLLNIKPIIMSDAKGQNISVEKVKGRKNSLDRLVEIFKEKYKNPLNGPIFICHADCLEDAEFLKQRISEYVDTKNVEIYVDYLGPVVGGAVGQSMIALFFYSDKTTIAG